MSISRIKSSQWKELLREFENLGLGKNIGKQKVKEEIDNEDNEEVGVCYLNLYSIWWSSWGFKYYFHIHVLFF